MPEYYRRYYSTLAQTTQKTFAEAEEAKQTMKDHSSKVESRVAFDLPDRVAQMHDIDIADPLRKLLPTQGKEMSALEMAGRIAQGKYMPTDTSLEQCLDMAIRVGLAIVTEGVTIAPLQGINSVDIRNNKDGTQYLAVSIAGPMRSAGGTESAVTMLIADHVRNIAGLDRYQANCFGDDESGRFVEELRVYEREAGKFQYSVVDDDIIHVISHLPVELAGVDTDRAEVVNHRNMRRIKTNRVRGGALRVLNDGLIGRAKKLLKRIEMFNLQDWDWLKEVKGAVKTDQEDAATKRMKEVITGRSVLSMTDRRGGFRLRYGRSCNTGFAAVGVHPAIAEILDHTVVAGTQIKTNIPGKGATVAFVDTIDTPTVLLKNGDVVRIKDVQHAASLRHNIQRILYLGDMLVSFGDFVENNASLIPSGYVEEYWRAQLKETAVGADREFLTKDPSLKEALGLSERLSIPLYPAYLYYWDMITPTELKSIAVAKTVDGAISYDMSAKPVLEKLGVPHVVQNNRIIISGDEAVVFKRILLDRTIRYDMPVPEALTEASGIEIRPKFSTSVGVRIGRPEKAAPRNMSPPVQSLFPVGEKGGARRDIIKASKKGDFYTEISQRECLRCNVPALSLLCRRCGNHTVLRRWCQWCKESTSELECIRCHKKTVAHSYHKFPLKEELAAAQKRVGHRAREPFKGVKKMIGYDRVAEPFEKGLLRQAYGLTVFKDGTVRYDATNATLTHFRPRWIDTAIETLHELGYTHDMYGNPLENDLQTVELMVQDIILPKEAGRYFVKASSFVDSLLVKLYDKRRHYKIHNSTDLVGRLVVGLAPHTSVGIVGRVIGFTNTHVCFATPNWHSAKRRDADGDADSIMMLMDVFLNFSKELLSDKIGGLMDAPLLVQPMVVPRESQPQAHNLEICSSFPLEFFDQSALQPKASKVDCIEMTKDRLGTSKEFTGYLYTHDTTTLVPAKARSAYSTLGSMLDKLDMQLRNAELIDAVDSTEIVTFVISTHLVPDMRGNLRAYAQQKFRCTSCGKPYPRPPLIGSCTCGNALIPTISRASVEKYLRLAKRLVENYDVGPYHKDRIRSLSEEMDLVFGKSAGNQMLLSDY